MPDHILLVRDHRRRSMASCELTRAAEIAFVGKAPGTYLMLLGGGFYGQRLNKIYRGLSAYCSKRSLVCEFLTIVFLREMQRA